MAGQQPEERVGCPVSLQRWQSMTFLHWAYDPDQVQALLPPGLQVDVWEGRAWVSITCFLMVDLRVNNLPALPAFPETNVRTYVRGPGGHDGLWFFSLEADSLATVVAASTVYGVPYRWSEMAVEQGDMSCCYRARRRFGPAAAHRIAVRVGEPCPAPSPLDHWLTGRWRAWTRIAGRLATIPVQHQPWPLQTATVLELEQSLLSASGLPEPDANPVVHASPGVDVRLGLPRFA